MTPIMLLMIFPLLLVAGMKLWRPDNFSWLEGGVQFVFTAILITGLYMGGKYLEMSATEYWTGQVTSKHRDHGTYEQPYDCFCTTDSKGNRSCSTCYETHYTVKWYLKSTIGHIGIKSLDRTSRSVYNTPNPQSYVNAYVGEPCSIPNTYLNYVQAVESSLVHEDGTGTLAGGFKGLIPSYPQLHSIYKLNRVIPVGAKLPGGVKAWNESLSELMKYLGGSKQINLFLVVAKVSDPSYIHTLKASWLGGNKNDAVVVIGTDGEDKILWADVFSWSKEPMFDRVVREEIEKQGKLDKDVVLGIIQEATMAHYVRRPMAEFEYLKDEVDPPQWIIVVLVIISIGGSILMAFIFDRVDLDEKLFGRSSRRSYRFRNRRR